MVSLRDPPPLKKDRNSFTFDNNHSKVIKDNLTSQGGERCTSWRRTVSPEHCQAQDGSRRSTGISKVPRMLLQRKESKKKMQSWQEST